MMHERDTERMLPGWQAASEAVAQELVVWREVQPRANLTHIEDAVFEAMQRLQARALEQWYVPARLPTSRLSQWRNDRGVRHAVVCWSRAAASGGRIDPLASGRRLELDRSYAACAECGAGLSFFP